MREASREPVEAPDTDLFFRPVRIALGLGWLSFQLYIIFFPQAPLFQRPLHLILALALLLLTKPLAGARLHSKIAQTIDLFLLLGVGAVLVYYMVSAPRLTERIEGIDKVFPVDIAFGLLLIVLLLEGVRRAVGWSLLSVLLVFLVYGLAGNAFPAPPRRAVDGHRHAFAFDPRVLGFGAPLGILAASTSLLAGTALWAAALAGFLGAPLNPAERVVTAACALGLIFSVAGSPPWLVALASSAAVLLWIFLWNRRIGEAR